MTITIYGLECTSTRKARRWFEKNNIPFVHRVISEEPLTVSELQSILRVAVDGTDGILATRSKIYNDLNLDFDTLTLHELLAFISKYPRLLKSPIIVDEKRLQAGFSEEEIRQFIPRKDRTKWMLNSLRLLDINPVSD